MVGEERREEKHERLPSHFVVFKVDRFKRKANIGCRQCAFERRRGHRSGFLWFESVEESCMSICVL
jgi:hypothetical protein